MPLCSLLAYEVIGARGGNSPCRRTARSWARSHRSVSTCCVCVCVSAVSKGGARGGWWEASLDGRVDASEVWTTVLHAQHGRPCAAGTAIHVEPTVTTCTCTCSGTSRPDRPPCEPHVCPHCLPFPALALSTRSHALLPPSRRPHSSRGPLAGETARILPRPHLTTHCRSPRPVLLSIACVDPLPLQVAAADTACNCLHCRPCHVWLLTAGPASDRAPKSLPWQAGARECATKHSSEPAV
jgi:hypothetical protein